MIHFVVLLPLPGLLSRVNATQESFDDIVFIKRLSEYI